MALKVWLNISSSRGGEGVPSIPHLKLKFVKGLTHQLLQFVHLLQVDVARLNLPVAIYHVEYLKLQTELVMAMDK